MKVNELQLCSIQYSLVNPLNETGLLLFLKIKKMPVMMNNSPIKNNHQLNTEGMYPDNSFNAPSCSGIPAATGVAFETKYRKSQIKEDMVMSEPQIKNDKALYDIFISIFLLSSQTKSKVGRIIVRERITGANTGPIHGTGIRNKMSQVNSDSGQSRNIFRKR